MKKQTAMFLSFSALLTIGAMSPQVLWHADKTSHRSPASIEQKDRLSEMALKSLTQKIEPKKDKMDVLLDDLAQDTRKKEQAKIDSQELKPLEKVELKLDTKVSSVEAPAPLKDLEHKSVAIESREVKLVEVEAQVSCLKEKQPKELEAEVKKLMEDKEKIMKELEELKASKKPDDKKEKKVAKTDYNEDILGIMSQLTSLMISQQQQSMMMMTNMFSMFQAQQPKQQSWYSPMSDYMSPYAFNASQFEFPNHKSIYSLEGMGQDVGLKYGYQSKPFYDYDYSRMPAQQSDFGPMFERSQFDLTGSFQPQKLEARPHNGFDFRPGVDSMSMDRISF